SRAGRRDRHVARIADADAVSREATEFELRAWLAAIVESSDDAIISKDLDGTILTWNRGAERVYGYTAEEAVGQSIAILMEPGSDEPAAIMESVRRGQRIDHYETVRIRKDGKRLITSVTISPVRDASGRIVGASAV